MAEHVTISKARFATLLRRVELHTAETYRATSPTYPPLGLVLMPQEEHDALHKAVQEFEALKRALYGGGLTKETVEHLIAKELRFAIQKSPQGGDWEERIPCSSGVPINVKSTDPRLTPDSERYGTAIDFVPKPRACFNPSTSCGIDLYDITQDDFEESNEKPGLKRLFRCHEKRSLLFANLSDGTTYKDIIDVVRGGRLLHIYLREDRYAIVSFVEGAAAEALFVSAKKRDIYIRQKRVEVRWADRQFQLPSHMANKISDGATRNLVIHGGASSITENQIREDMEHIHNLVILDVKVKNADIYVSTNSINNACFARTCMISRREYKGLRVEWYPDECDGPLPKLQLQAVVTLKTDARRKSQNPYAPLFVVEDDCNDVEGDAKDEP